MFCFLHFVCCNKAKQELEQLKQEKEEIERISQSREQNKHRQILTINAKSIKISKLQSQIKQENKKVDKLQQALQVLYTMCLICVCVCVINILLTTCTMIHAYKM